MDRQKISIIFVCLIFIFLSPLTLSAMIKANSSEEAFTGTDSGTAKQARLSSPGMAQLVVQGAGSFLESHSNYLSFLQKYELSEIESIEDSQLLSILDRSITAMEKAEYFYNQLKRTADYTPYNYEIYWTLVCFNYSEFQYRNGLNRDVFTRVSGYLRYGDVRGCYGQILGNCRHILANLKTVKSSIEYGNNRRLTDLWRLNQTYSESLLFGQYIAEIFFEILK